MRRRAPRPLGVAVERALADAAPATLLTRVQSAWSAAAGPVVAAEATPAGEAGSVVTVRCESSVWAQELALMEADLTARLNAELGAADGSGPVRGLRFVTGP